MPLDFRYHLASLAAVFCALVIGILLGVALKEGPALSKQVTELRKEFQSSEYLRNIDHQTDQFNARTEKLLVRSRLSGRNVALVMNPLPHDSEKTNALRQTLRDSGAQITCEITCQPGLRQLTAAQMTELYQQLGVSAPEQLSSDDFANRLGQDLGAGPTKLFSLLEDRQLIKVEGDPTERVSVIIFMGGATAKDDSLVETDLPFLQGSASRGITVIATEPFETERSVMREYQRIAPITIDNIDHAAGRIALVLAIAKNQRGNFGYKQTADDVAPTIE